MIWIRVNRNPIVRFLIFRVWRSLTTFILSNLEALFYLRRRKAAIRELNKLRENLIFLNDLTFWYTQCKFTRSPDPASGKIDFVSKPWVSVARNFGDCDDMTAIAKYVLSPNIDEGFRVSVYDKSGTGHSIYVARTKSEWSIVSNQWVHMGYENINQAIYSVYKEETAFAYIYGKGYVNFEETS